MNACNFLCHLSAVNKCTFWRRKAMQNCQPFALEGNLSVILKKSDVYQGTTSPLNDLVTTKPEHTVRMHQSG